MTAVDHLLLQMAVRGITSIPAAERLLEEALAAGVLIVVGETPDGRVLYQWAR